MPDVDLLEPQVTDQLETMGCVHCRLRIRAARRQPFQVSVVWWLGPMHTALEAPHSLRFFMQITLQWCLCWLGDL